MSVDKAERLAAIRAANAGKQAPAPTSLPIARAEPAPDSVDLPPAMSLTGLIGLLLAAVIGVFAAVVALPTWLPGLSASLLGTEPKAYWYLARSSAWVAYGLLWLAMVFGLLMTNKLARAWPGGLTAFDLHQHTSLLGLAFALFHGLILLGDRYIHASLAQILAPFTYTGFNPLAVGLGQIALYGLALVGLSFYVKAQIGRQLWRLIHLVSFSVFALALLHGIASGTDSSAQVAQITYWVTGGSVLFLTIYRILASRRGTAIATG
jgi:predicted ferric reductase